MAALAAYFLALYAIGTATNFRRAWAMFRVDHLTPVYLDLRAVTAGIESQRDGYDPLRENPRDPLKRVMNYPRTWLLLSHLGITQKETVPIGIGIDLAFFAALLILIGPITPQQGVFYALLVCSPAIMLGVERANIDLLIFVLLSTAIVLLSRQRAESSLPYAIVTLCGLLKLYPICALSVALRERAQRAITVISSGVIFFALYLLLIRHDLVLISRGTPRLTNESYGSEIIFEKLFQQKIDTGGRF